MGLGLGKIVNKALDTFLPDAVGDAVGAAVDIATGNIPGAVRNAVDLLEDCAEWAGAEDLSNILEVGLTIYDSATGGDPTALGLLGSLADADSIDDFIADGLQTLAPGLPSPIAEGVAGFVVDAVGDEVSAAGGEALAAHGLEGSIRV